MFEHKGYQGIITTVDTGAGLFHGRVIGIQDVVTFEGKAVTELVKAFRDSVDDYLAFCEERKEAPEKPFSGKFVVRLPAELHRLASEAAGREDLSLNTWMLAAVESRLDPAPTSDTRLSFDELNQVATCVAAILAEKGPAAASPRACATGKSPVVGSRRRNSVRE